MSRAFTLGVSLLACAGFAAAANQLSMADIPTCAINCITKALPLSTCPLTDQACLCMDSEFNAAVEVCARSACTLRENLGLAKLTWAQCEFSYQDVRPKIYWTSGVVYTIMLAFFVLRMISKAAKLSKWGHDDTLIVLSFILLNVLFIASTIVAARSHFGVDMWVVGADGVTAFLKLMFILEMVYVLAMAAIKASILFCFLRIFPGRAFRRAVLVTQIFNLLVAVTWVLLCCTQCQPISYLWDGWDGEHKGRCGIDPTAVGLIHVAVQIAIDVVMLILPITQVYKLQMDRKKKLGVMAMFLVGIFLTIVSCLRIESLITFQAGLSKNPTVEAVTATMWAFVELGVGIVVASMPNVRHLLRVISSKMAPSVKASVSSLSSNGRTDTSDLQTNQVMLARTKSINETLTDKADSIASPSKSSRA